MLFHSPLPLNSTNNKLRFLFFSFFLCFFINPLHGDTLCNHHFPVDCPSIHPSGSGIPLKTLQVFTNHWGKGGGKSLQNN